MADLFRLSSNVLIRAICSGLGVKSSHASRSSVMRLALQEAFLFSASPTHKKAYSREDVSNARRSSQLCKRRCVEAPFERAVGPIVCFTPIFTFFADLKPSQSPTRAFCRKLDCDESASDSSICGATNDCRISRPVPGRHAVRRSCAASAALGMASCTHDADRLAVGARICAAIQE